MTKIDFNSTYAGISNQPPWRKKPGATKDQLNMRNAIDKGATTRNGTDLISILSILPSTLDIDDVAFFGFRGDIIIVWSTGLVIIDSETGTQKTLTDSTGGFPYLSSATGGGSFRFAAFQNSIMILNREVSTALENSDNFSITATVDFFKDLSTTATVGQHYKVLFNDGSIPKGYYKRVSVDGELDWQFVAKPNQPNSKWTATTMPHRLLRNSDGSYTFNTFDYTDRRSGTDGTNPAPDWAGDPLEAIAFFSSRLFLGSGGLITASSSRDRSLFFNYDADVPTDPSNPINQALANAQAGEIFHMQQVGNDLLLVCEKGEVIFTSGQEQLINTNGQDAMIASYKPLEIPPAFDSRSCVIIDSFNVVKEFTVNQNGYLIPSGDLNSQSLRLFNDMNIYSCYRFGDQTYINSDNGLYVHEMFPAPTQQGSLVSSWTRFDFNSTDSTSNQVYFMNEQSGYISIIVKNETNGFVLLRYIHGEEPSIASYDINPTLDFRKYVTGTFIQDRNVTQFTYSSDEDENIVIRDQIGGEHTPVVITPLYVELHGIHTGEHCVGIKYEALMDFEQFYVGSSNYRATVSSMTTYFKDTMSFDVEIYELRSETLLDSYEYKTHELGIDPMHQGTTSDRGTIRTGDTTMPVMQDAKDIRIRITKTGSTPMTISALSFDVKYADPLGT